MIKKKDENTVQHPDYPWYIKVGDFVFGFTPGDSGNTEAPKSANSDDSTSAPAPGESHEQKNSGEGGSSEGPALTIQSLIVETHTNASSCN